MKKMVELIDETLYVQSFIKLILNDVFLKEK